MYKGEFKMKIRDLKSNKGIHSILTNATVTEEITKTNKKYLKITLDDGDKATIMIWDDNPKYEEYKKLGENALIEANIEFVKTNSAGYDEFKLHDFTIKKRPSLTDCVEIEELKSELRKILSSIENKELKSIAYSLCKDKELLEKLFLAPATEKSAYSFRGGLLAHIVRTCKTAIALSDVYNSWSFNKGDFNEGLDKDLLIICAILHDIGKIDYYEFNGDVVQKTFKGELLDDSYISATILREVLNKSNLTEEQKILIEHAIISSKGTLNFGAITTPRTKEANIFHMLDRIDSMMGNFEYMQRVSLGDDFQKLHDKQYCLSSLKDYNSKVTTIEENTLGIKEAAITDDRN
jgi:3'-5' exoribonuclease